MDSGLCRGRRLRFRRRGQQPRRTNQSTARLGLDACSFRALSPHVEWRARPQRWTPAGDGLGAASLQRAYANCFHQRRGLGGLWPGLLRHSLRASLGALAAAAGASAISGVFCFGAHIGAAAIAAEPGAAYAVQSQRRVQPAGSDRLFAAAQHAWARPAAELRWAALRRICSHAWYCRPWASPLGHGVFARK